MNILPQTVGRVGLDIGAGEGESGHSRPVIDIRVKMEMSADHSRTLKERKEESLSHVNENGESVCCTTTQ